MQCSDCAIQRGDDAPIGRAVAQSELSNWESSLLPNEAVLESKCCLKRPEASLKDTSFCLYSVRVCLRYYVVLLTYLPHLNDRQ